MFKVDWWSALGGVVVGYYAKGKVEAVKAKVRSICTDTGVTENLKNSFGDPQATQATQAEANGQNPNGH